MEPASIKPHILDLDAAALEQVLAEWKEPKFRARQLFSWLHEHGELSAAQMTNLTKSLRTRLEEHFAFSVLRLVDQAHSTDGSIKYAWRTQGGGPVEAVLMPVDGKATALCISVESGCPFACSFCHTGYLGRGERLSVGAMLEQIYQAEKLSGHPVERLVVMGMGEPLTDLTSQRRLVSILTGDPGRAWSPRRITLSTVGLIKPMLELARSFPRVNLALSLHATTPQVRSRLMPRADNDLEQLAVALHYYRKLNGGKISLEYALIKGVNDRDSDLRRLINFANLKPGAKPVSDLDNHLVKEANERPDPPRIQDLPLHVNLIAYNPIPEAPELKPATELDLDIMGRRLRDAGVPVTVRHSKGSDIGAACGMLGGSLPVDDSRHPA